MQKHNAKNRCPYCNGWHEHFTNCYCNQEVEPQGNFVAVCNDCCKLTIYDACTMCTRQPNEIELKALLSRPDITAAINIIEARQIALRPVVVLRNKFAAVSTLVQ
jgi:hypothetical protein